MQIAYIWYMASFGVVTLCLDFASRQSSRHLHGHVVYIAPSRACRCLSSRRRSSSRRSGPPVVFFVPLKTINLASSFHKTKTNNFVKTAHVLFSIYVFQSTPPPPKKKKGIRSYYTSMFHLGSIPGIQSCTCPYTEMIRSIRRMLVGSVHICYLS